MSHAIFEKIIQSLFEIQISLDILYLTWKVGGMTLVLDTNVGTVDNCSPRLQEWAVVGRKQNQCSFFNRKPVFRSSDSDQRPKDTNISNDWFLPKFL